MKRIDDGGSSAKWESRLLNDFSFIKKHKRYRLTSDKLKLLINLAPVMLLLLFVGSLTHKTNTRSILIIVTPLIILSLRLLYNYISMLRFKAVSSPFYQHQNMEMIERFLRLQQLNIYRSAAMPEVFQIVSRSLNNGLDQKEVVVFIAGDREILVNSHFAVRSFRIDLSQPTHAPEMIKKLQYFINNSHPATSGMMKPFS